MHKQNLVNISAVTHAGRPFTAANAREHGAAAIDTKVSDDGNPGMRTLRFMIGDSHETQCWLLLCLARKIQKPMSSGEEY